TDRLWRRNLRDNNGDGQITIADGVDLNRNFADHWGYDDEGSSGDPANDTYRGPAPASEPETQAVVNMVQSQNFKFVLSYHTYGDLILYPWGWQVQTPSLDDPIFVAQAGTDANPAVYDTLAGHGYDPGVGADLYTTNGEFTDWTYGSLGIPSQTIEVTDGGDYGFVFPDDEAMVQQTFLDNLPFALAYIESAADPAHPVSPVGIQTEDAYHTPLTTSNGSEQAVTVLARKGLALQLTYSINGGAEQTAAFAEKLGTVYNEKPGVYYSRYQAVITGQQAGDSVTYSIRAGAGQLGPYSYSVGSATGNPILLVAAEDYTGNYPTYPPGGPFYLNYYTAALDSGPYAGKYDIWDVDAKGAVPTEPEVLSHYRAAIWYTGDDYAATVPNGLATNGIEVLNVRDWINYDGGKLLATGQDFEYPAAAGLLPDDFYQYYLGAYIDVDGGGVDSTTGAPFDVTGVDGDPVLGGLAFSLQGGDGASNQAYNDTFLATSYFLSHFGDRLAARYVRPGGPFDPHTGDYDVYSQMADYSFKRLSRTFTVPAAPATFKFWMSADTEPDWDFAFVEINEAGTDTWTTLPDVNGLTTTDTGLSCASGWVSQIHPFLAHYMDAACNPTGTTGSWNAFTGNSGGWQQVEMDLSAYAGKTVEVSISYASDWGTQGLGVWVDDIEAPGQPVESFESGLGDWTVTVAPGSPASNNWVRAARGALPEGPGLRTPNSLHLGFGFEGIADATTRNEVMQKAMSYFGQ
ncbi:MAG: M14 family zinc carboxypeptidase, partial [Nitrososphaerales archaeon]